MYLTVYISSEFIVLSPRHYSPVRTLAYLTSAVHSLLSQTLLLQFLTPIWLRSSYKSLQQKLIFPLGLPHTTPFLQVSLFIHSSDSTTIFYFIYLENKQNKNKSNKIEYIFIYFILLLDKYKCIYHLHINTGWLKIAWQYFGNRF